MSHLLWKYYWENDVDRFRRLLAPAGPSAHSAAKSPSLGAAFASPSTPNGSPRTTPKPRKVSGFALGATKSKDGGIGLSRHEVNSRDHAGLTVLLRAASSTHLSARDFVQALLEHPQLDLYAQDLESGWNALHRSLYAGNASIARMLLAKERADLTNFTNQSIVGKVGQLIKTKDHEGNSPFDVYNSTIAPRVFSSQDAVAPAAVTHASWDGGDSDDEAGASTPLSVSLENALENGQTVSGNEIYVFGSNKNSSLGVGDEDDRQYPERVTLRRPKALLRRLYDTYQERHGEEVDPFVAIEDIPTLIRNPKLVIKDVVMSKFHTAVLTDDCVSNLYVCGVGRGGRLGLGDENTHFGFVPLEGPFASRKVKRIALGQNHSLAVAGNGELWTWGSNVDCQLGYTLPVPMRPDEPPMSLSPRQVFGSLKKEIVQGIAASAFHSVAHTGSSLYCWGRNLGQLAIMDADARSLEVQVAPRKVAASLFSAPIKMVSAIDKATICLLSNSTVWVFTNYGYHMVRFPHPSVLSNQRFANLSCNFHYDSRHRDIRNIASGGNTIAAITSFGELFTMQLSDKLEYHQGAGSTTNPVRIKNAVTEPHCVWDAKKDGVASVSVGENGSVIICTNSGAAWKRVKRTKATISKASSLSDGKRKDFKFQRVPYVNDCVAVRSSTFGAFAAVRQDCDVMCRSIWMEVRGQSIQDAINPLCCIEGFRAVGDENDADKRRWPWDTVVSRGHPERVRHGILESAVLRPHELERDMTHWLATFPRQSYNMEIRTSCVPDVKIPIHSWLLGARSSIMRKALSSLQNEEHVGDDFVIAKNGDKFLVTLIGIDFLTMLNIVRYTYLDAIIPVWEFTRHVPALASRFRQVRIELMRTAAKLQMSNLETAARLQANVETSLAVNFREAFADPDFFHDADTIIELDGHEVMAHSLFLCQRCPFFDGMFHGRSQGGWLSGRYDAALEAQLIRVDLKHIRPETFHYVLKHLYADVGEDLFNDVCLDTLDELSELVLDVMDVANELMLDRLSHICQSVLGKFVSTRNISNLLNEISPYSVTRFKNTGLEYLCMQLESMLENHLLDVLDEDLLLELDDVVRANQLWHLPRVRNVRRELRLHEQYPDLRFDIEEERRRRVREMAFKNAQRVEEKRPPSSIKARIGSLDESSLTMATPLQTRRGSRPFTNEPFSPNLRPKDLSTDLIFAMDDEDSAPVASSLATKQVDSSNTSRRACDQQKKPEALAEGDAKSIPTSTKVSPSRLTEPIAEPANRAYSSKGSTSTPTKSNSAPWAAHAPPSSKLGLKDIMQEMSPKPAATTGMASQAEKTSLTSKPPSRMSQKERKRQTMLLSEAETVADKGKANVTAWETIKSAARPAPWTATAAPSSRKIPLQKTNQSESSRAQPSLKPLLAVEDDSVSSKRRAASPDTRFPGQGRASSAPTLVTASRAPSQKAVLPHSKSYIQPAPKAEATVGMSMADIIGQQQQEQRQVKEAVAKRSLQEIQEEQAFQEWWDQESRRTQEEEARRQARTNYQGRGGAKKGGKKGRGGSSKPDEASPGGEKTGEATAKSETTSRPPSRGRGGKARRERQSM